MKTIKSLKDITALEVGDVVMFDNLKYVVNKNDYTTQYYLYCPTGYNDIIFEKLNLKKRDFVEKLGINASYICDFPEVCSLEALTAIVSALFKEYKKQKELPKTWEKHCVLHAEKCTDDIGQIGIHIWMAPRTFCFPTKELAEEFLTNFKDLFEIAKPLI